MYVPMTYLCTLSMYLWVSSVPCVCTYDLPLYSMYVLMSYLCTLFMYSRVTCILYLCTYEPPLCSIYVLTCLLCTLCLCIWITYVLFVCIYESSVYPLHVDNVMSFANTPCMSLWETLIPRVRTYVTRGWRMQNWLCLAIFSVHLPLKQN